MAFGLGLGAALLWGVADFLIRVTGRSLGVHRAMLYAQGFGALALAVVVAADSAALARALAAPWPAWAAAIGAAPIGLAATVATYRALAIGRLGLVSPIVGAYGAVTAALSLLTGEQLGLWSLVGIATTTLGVVLVSRPSRQADAGPARDRRGIGYALAACLGFGVQFWIQGRFAVPDLGAAIPVWLFYTQSTLILGAAAAVRRPRLSLSRRESVTVLATGTAAVGGYLVLSAGLATGQVALVTVLSALQSAVAVALAGLFLGERLARHQVAGLLAIVGGLALIQPG